MIQALINKNKYNLIEEDEWEKFKKRGYHSPGELWIWLGNYSNKPERTLIPNGAELDIPLSENDLYWDLYQVIGATYNESNTEEGKFKIPDLMTVDNGRFVRCAQNEESIGKTQIDEIRKISGWVNTSFRYLDGGSPTEDFSSADNLDFDVSGAFSSTWKNSKEISVTSGKNIKIVKGNLTFDANQNTLNNTNNKMAGHANGEDIHPANISLLYLISF